MLSGWHFFEEEIVLFRSKLNNEEITYEAVSKFDLKLQWLLL